jgi:hypothetical protein
MLLFSTAVRCIFDAHQIQPIIQLDRSGKSDVPDCGSVFSRDASLGPQASSLRVFVRSGVQRVRQKALGSPTGQATIQIISYANRSANFTLITKRSSNYVRRHVDLHIFPKRRPGDCPTANHSTDFCSDGPWDGLAASGILRFQQTRRAGEPRSRHRNFRAVLCSWPFGTPVEQD